MIKYQILEEQILQYQTMIIGLTSESLTDYFDEISILLSSKNFHGKVLLDYYSYNRSQKRRFYEIEYDGNNFPIKTIKRVFFSENVRESLNSFYKRSNIPEVLYIK